MSKPLYIYVSVPEVNEKTKAAYFGIRDTVLEDFRCTLLSLATELWTNGTITDLADCDVRNVARIDLLSKVFYIQKAISDCDIFIMADESTKDPLCRFELMLADLMDKEMLFYPSSLQDEVLTVKYMSSEGDLENEETGID